MVGAISKCIYGNFEWTNKANWEKVKKEIIQLPVSNNKIDFDFMESFINKLELLHINKLKNYLLTADLKSFELTKEEKDALNLTKDIIWSKFNLKELFGKSNNGKRLESFNRIKGTLPFVTAGELNEGISDFISNDVKIFKRNTITIDMFGSAKYRNYEYGADDHVTIIHTETLDKYSALFVTSAIHKSSHNGQFNYGKNFYAKDADSLIIELPTKNNKPDYLYMSLIISAIQKLILKDIVEYSNKK